MVLETYMNLCVTEPDFPLKIFLPPKLGKMDPKQAKNRFFLIYWKNYSSIFTEFDR